MKTFSTVFAALCMTSIAFAEGGTVHGTVTRVNSTAHTIAIRTAEGSEYTLKVAGKTVVHGTETGAKDSLEGIKEGSEVVAHYSAKGATKTAVEIDKIGRDGLSSVEGTVVRVNKGAKTLVVKGADGTEQIFRTTDQAIVTAGKDTAAGAQKSANVTVYYTEEAGKKVAHFFTRR
jgi:hypothetical protein